MLAYIDRLQLLPQSALPEVSGRRGEWLAAREAELLPVPYFHVVFSLPARIADIAYQNKAVIYDLLLTISAETLLTIAADPQRLGARIGILSVLHTWGSALTHHPHVHMIVPGGGFALDGKRWVCCRPRYLLGAGSLFPVPPVVAGLTAAHSAGKLQFFGKHAKLSDESLRRLSGTTAQQQVGGLLQAPLRRAQGSAALSRPLHPPRGHLDRRLVARDAKGVTFKWKDYRIDGPERYKIMTLPTHEFIRRFLMHVLPAGFHRIRYYGLLASAKRAERRSRPRTARAAASAPDRRPQGCQRQ